MSSAPPTPATDDFKIDAFMSYARQDIGFVRKLREALEVRGKAVMMDLSSLMPGQPPDVLQVAADIERARSFIFVLSENSRRGISRNELEIAVKLDKPIIILALVRWLKIPEEVSPFHFIDFSNEDTFDQHLEELVRTLDRAGAQTPQAAAAQETELPAPDTEQAGVPLVVKIHSPGSTSTEDFPATPAFGRLLALAARIKLPEEEQFDLSFASLLLAMLTSPEMLSRWFARYIKDAGIKLDEWLAERGLDRSRLDEITSPPLTEIELSNLGLPHVRTESAGELIRAAYNLSRLHNLAEVKEGKAYTKVRHLFGAYIYSAAEFEKDLKGLGLNREAWSNAFLGQMQKLYPHEIEFWKHAHRNIFHTEPIPLEEIEGPSTHIASDMWTLNDTLGYRAYAHAIYRFMTHKQTKPPLTISIQAPWGGGKTSLMRMIQHALDPEALSEIKSEQKQPRGELTIKAALDEIDRWISAKTQEALPPVPADEKRELLTVWFNAWKYESVNQVWAGLVDAIMQQIAARLPLIEREMFWLRLNLKRVDADKLRHRIHERIFRYFWRGMRYWLLTIGAALATSVLLAFIIWFFKSNALLSVLTGIGFSTAGSAAAAIWKYFKAKTEVEKEPAAVSLGEYLDIPDYSTEMGFIHRVEADLRRVLASVPVQYYPIVIFVDDLDRCSPAKVGQVVEAVNLFLAGDFPNCMFVMGMDTEMVAAALQAAHKDMIAELPADAGIPVGWRFMDKFVQLPFLIPPTEKGNLTRYTASLFSDAPGQTPDARVDELARETAPRISSTAAVSVETERLRAEHRLSEVQVARMKDQLEARVIERKLDEGIEKFNDRNPEIRRVIAAATDHFRGNPRELKRFINAFRFQYFLWWAQRAQGLEVPTLDQLRRWTVLSMKWPEVVRWLRRSGGNEWRVKDGANLKDGEEEQLPTRLRLLEEISSETTDLEAWHKRAAASLRIKPETTAWLNDDDLLQFFYEECAKYPVGQRLSDGLGRGLW